MKAIYDIDPRIAALEREVLGLRAVRNMLVPVGRLPDELLIRVAHHCVFETDDQTDDLAPPSTLCAISSVCTRWRSVLCAAPELWAVVSGNWPTSLLHQYLLRAGSHELTFRTMMQDPPSNIALDLMVKALDQTRCLVVQLEDASSMTMIMEHLKTTQSRTINSISLIYMAPVSYGDVHLDCNSFSPSVLVTLSSIILRDVIFDGFPIIPALRNRSI
jgi:hypothetical protein